MLFVVVVCSAGFVFLRVSGLSKVLVAGCMKVVLFLAVCVLRCV